MSLDFDLQLSLRAVMYCKSLKSWNVVLGLSFLSISEDKRGIALVHLQFL